MAISTWDVVAIVLLALMVLTMMLTAQNPVSIAYNLVTPVLVTFLVSRHYGAIWTTRTTRKIQHSSTINPALKDWQGTLSSVLIGIGYRSRDWGSGVKYKKGKFVADGPSEPSEAFSSLVRDHLMSGYKEVWEEWDALKIESAHLNRALAGFLNRSIEHMSQDVPTVLENTQGRLLELDFSKVVKDVLVAGLDNALGFGTNDIIENSPQSDMFYVRWENGSNIAQFPTPEASAEACRQLRLLLERISKDQELVELARQCKNAQARIDALGASLKEISHDVDAGGMLEGECHVCRKF
jgi:hypothetical protein